MMAPVTSIGVSAHEGAVGDSRRSMGLEPVFQGKIDAGLPAFTAVMDRMHSAATVARFILFSSGSGHAHFVFSGERQKRRTRQLAPSRLGVDALHQALGKTDVQPDGPCVDA